MVILASASPRRKELLRQIFPQYEIIPALGKEMADKTLPPKDYVASLAEQKCEEVFSSHPDCLVIGCDTIVVFNGKILGKPQDKEEAVKMLNLLSGRKHQVITGVTVLSKEREETFAAVSHVTIAPLSEKEIDYYIEKYQPYDKAGAYGIQEWIGMIGVTEIEGSFFNVMGLPVQRLYSLLKTF